MRRDDWLLAQLPIGMVEEDFFVRFVSIFQDVATSLVDGADNMANILDVTVAPPAQVRWMAEWIGLNIVDSSLPDATQRHLVRESSKMLAWRGTRHGLATFLRLVTGADAQIEESGGVYGEHESPGEHPWVRIHVASTGWLPEKDFLDLVRDEIPANVTAEIWVAGRRVQPMAEAITA
jgi:phage tail-like protein